jgi:LAGLIDADG-like domain
VQVSEGFAEVLGVLENGQFVPFLRGLYQAEGSIYRRYSKKYGDHARVYDNLLVVQVRMTLPTLMSQLCQEIGRLGIRTTKLSSKNGVHTLRITDQKEIRRFFDIVRPRYKTAPRPAML